MVGVGAGGDIDDDEDEMMNWLLLLLLWLFVCVKKDYRIECSTDVAFWFDSIYKCVQVKGVWVVSLKEIKEL